MVCIFSKHKSHAMARDTGAILKNSMPSHWFVSSRTIPGSGLHLVLQSD
jgi:hypothetical protein